MKPGISLIAVQIDGTLTMSASIAIYDHDSPGEDGGSILTLHRSTVEFDSPWIASGATPGRPYYVEALKALIDQLEVEMDSMPGTTLLT